ncbi:uncharacterized protein LOC143264863 [Megachile rotundata]|uniref:uncharacterized protein LOC143264863 n=1 Tax=Megachile rotundata TaxID=143995 RepID=UPI003FD61C52
MTQPESNNKANVSTFVVQTKGKCYTRGEPGHYSRQYTRSQQQSNRGRGAHSSQGQRGHHRGFNRGGNYRGQGCQRGRGQGQPRAESSGEQQGDYSSEAWLTQKNLMMKRIEIWKIANLKT